MPKRPVSDPAWATAAPAGNVIEPVTLRRSAGFVKETGIAAPYVNYLLQSLADWVAYATGPNFTNYTPVEVSGGGLIELDVDATTAEGDARVRRLLAVDAVTNTRLLTSLAGDLWISLTPVPASGAFGVARRVGYANGPSKWVVLADDSGAARVHTADYSTATNSPIDDDTKPWGAPTLPTLDVPTALALAQSGADAGRVAVGTVGASGVKIAYSNTGITAFTAVTFGGSWAGEETRDLAHTGAAWLAVSQNGTLARATAATGTWTVLGTSLGAGDWRLAAGPAGLVVAYQPNLGTAPDWYVSTDHGASWSLAAAPALHQLKKLRYVAGAWVLASAAAPYLAYAADPAVAASWRRVTVPVGPIGAPPPTLDLYDVVECDGALVVGGNERVLVGLRAG